MISDYANGTVNITVGNKHFNDTVSNGVGFVNLSDLPGGIHEAKVEFTSTDRYNNNAKASYKLKLIMIMSLKLVRM